MEKPYIRSVYTTGWQSFCIELSNGHTLACSFGTYRDGKYELGFAAFDADNVEVTGPGQTIEVQANGK